LLIFIGEAVRDALDPRKLFVDVAVPEVTAAVPVAVPGVPTPEEQPYE
jgi:hypothetical protein